MQRTSLLLLFFACLIACKNSTSGDNRQKLAFERIKWTTKDGLDYPYRDKMLDDLMNHYELHGVKKDSLLRLLGSPDRIDSNYLFYQISQQRVGLFPIHTKTLVIKLNSDSALEWRKIHE